jgi:acyl-CoA-dependent ceramide synthase
MNMKGLWTNWPNREIAGIEKWYYLVQYAFWLQQLIVIHIEQRRKDHYQMLTHHIITCALVYLSYSYHVTRIGITILVIMDVVDILLSVSLLFLKHANN